MKLFLWSKKNIYILILGIILILAIFLRVYSLSKVPPELFGDELDVGYQAFSILKTGRDIQGNFLPIYFHSLAEFRAPLFIYSAVPFVAIFGLNEWGVRLTAAFWGILGVLVIYLLTQKLFNNSKLSVLSALLLTISPWHLQYSRAGFEVSLLLFLLMTATWLFLKGLENPKFCLPAAFLFALTPYTYSTAVVFMPFLLISLLLIFKNELKKIVRDKIFGVSLLIFALVLIPMTTNVVSGQSRARFETISLFTRQDIVKEITEKQVSEPQIGRFFHNKLLSYSFEFSRNYLWAFSPQFLFSDGDPVGRHHVGKMGEFYWFILPLLILGIIALTKPKIEKRFKLLILAWAILAPIPSSLTIDGGYHATRLFILILPLTILAAIGANYLLENFKKLHFKAITLVIFLVGVINLITYFHQYWADYPADSWRWWQVGYREAFSYVRQNQDQYDRIIVNNTYEPALIRFLFYMQYDPAKFRKEFRGDKPQKKILQGFDGFQLENRYFFGSKTTEFSQILDHKTLYLASARDESPTGVPAGVKILKTITNYLNQPIFYLLTK